MSPCAFRSAAIRCPSFFCNTEFSYHLPSTVTTKLNYGSIDDRPTMAGRTILNAANFALEEAGPDRLIFYSKVPVRNLPEDAFAHMIGGGMPWPGRDGLQEAGEPKTSTSM